MEPLAAALAMCLPMETGPYPPAGAVVDAFVAAYNSHDAAAVRELVTEDAEIGAPGNLVTGREMAEAYESSLFREYPTVRIEVLQRLEANDLVAQTERISGMESVEEPGLAVYRVDSGCIVSMSINK